MPFAGGIDLGTFAKARNAATKATIGLAELTTTVLRRHLPKDPAIRVSTEWGNKELPATHMNYAALDVYAVWRIYQVLSSPCNGPGNPVDATSPGGMQVSLFAPDQTTIVAHGHIAPDRPKQYNGIKVTDARALVTITEIAVPGHLVSGELLPSRKDSSLLSLPSVPFNMVCKTKHLCTTSRALSERIPRDPEVPALSTHSTTGIIPPTIIPPSVHHTAANDNMDGPEAPDCPDSDAEPDATSWFADMDTVSPSDQRIDDSEIDSAGVEMAKVARHEVEKVFPSGAMVLPSRVLGDIVHVMRQLTISSSHGLHRPFARALRDAFFDYDLEDKAIVTTFLEGKNLTFEKMLQEHPVWIKRRVKRFVPAPEELFERVHRVFSAYGPRKDARPNSKPLFSTETWKVTTNILENIRRGFYSDPPGIPLYHTQGKDKYDLMCYRCIRGTNGVEGGVHQNVIRGFGAFNAGPDFAVELLRDYALHHNLKVSVAHSIQTKVLICGTTGRHSKSNRSPIFRFVRRLDSQETEFRSF
jgi:hypothetical protein